MSAEITLGKGQSKSVGTGDGSALLTHDVLGHPTDFLVTQKREGSEIKITVETIMPAMRWDAERQCLLTWQPPRYPWPNK